LEVNADLGSIASADADSFFVVCRHRAIINLTVFVLTPPIDSFLLFDLVLILYLLVMRW
jgi:hypothetical protein